MKRLLLFTLICILSLIFCVCIKPIEPIKPPPRGFYNGTFQIDFYSVNDSMLTMQQNILWTFSDQKFWCQIDTLNLIDSNFICDFYGNYLLDGNDNVIVFSDVIMAPGECDSNLVPLGSFEVSRIFNQAAIDTILLYQHTEISTGVIEKTIKLARIVE